MITNICVYGLFPAIQGIRNSYQSKDKSDSTSVGLCFFGGNVLSYNHCFLGKKDEGLIRRKILLHNNEIGHQERKFMRQIFVGMDIKTSLKHWAQIDTYKVGTVRDSESTMHNLTLRELKQSDFLLPITQRSLDDLNILISLYQKTINLKPLTKTDLEYLNIVYNFDSVLEKNHCNVDSTIFAILENNLPSGFLLSSYLTCNYENLRNIYLARKDHKMFYWEIFLKSIMYLPYAELFFKNGEN